MNISEVSKEIVREVVIESPVAAPIVVGSFLVAMGVKKIWNEYHHHPTCDEPRSYGKPILLTGLGVVVLTATVAYRLGLFPQPSAEIGKSIVLLVPTAVKTAEQIKMIFNPFAQCGLIEGSTEVIQEAVKAVVKTSVNPATQCLLVNGTIVDTSAFVEMSQNGFTDILPTVTRVIPELPPAPTGLLGWAKRIFAIT